MVRAWTLGSQVHVGGCDVCLLISVPTLHTVLIRRDEWAQNITTKHTIWNALPASPRVFGGGRGHCCRTQMEKWLYCAPSFSSVDSAYLLPVFFLPSVIERLPLCSPTCRGRLVADVNNTDAGGISVETQDRVGPG